MFKHTEIRPWLFFVFCLILLLSLLTPTPAAALPAGFQEYLVMGDEYQIHRMFNALRTSGSFTTEMSSIVTLIATSNGQQIYYDHWEDGYEVNIFTPVQTSPDTERRILEPDARHAESTAKQDNDELTFDVNQSIWMAVIRKQHGHHPTPRQCCRSDRSRRSCRTTG